MNRVSGFFGMRNDRGVTAMPKEKNSKVTIIISVYNGEKYLAEQLLSIYNQTYPNITIYVRDDGSTDRSKEILDDQSDRVEYEAGDNLGVTQSFLTALSRAPQADYYAFADQDDVWLEDKIERAVGFLDTHDQSIPLCYFTEYEYCDEDLSIRGRSNLNRRGVDTPKLLFDCPTSGNTMLINESLRSLVLSKGFKGACYHDWYISMICSLFGELLYDSKPSLLYRRSGNNVTPSGEFGVKLLKYRIEKFINGDGLNAVKRQNELVLNNFREKMTDRQVELFRFFLSSSKVKRALYPHWLRQKALDELALRALFIANKI